MPRVLRTSLVNAAGVGRKEGVNSRRIRWYRQEPGHKEPLHIMSVKNERIMGGSYFYESHKNKLKAGRSVLC